MISLSVEVKKRISLGCDYIREIKIWIAFHREPTIEISLRAIRPAIRPKNSDYIRDNSKICAKKTRDLAKNTRDPTFLAHTFPAIFPARLRPSGKCQLPRRPGSKIWIAGKFFYVLAAMIVILLIH